MLLMRGKMFAPNAKAIVTRNILVRGLEGQVGGLGEGAEVTVVKEVTREGDREPVTEVISAYGNRWWIRTDALRAP
jgi:hypothetical protein